MTIAAGIVQRNKFISPGDKRYKAAINYLDKDKSKRINNMDKYFAFENEIPTNEAIRMTALFDGRQDALDQTRKKELKELFKVAQAKESPMWQTVYSFDNEYLKELGLYRKGEHHFIDEDALKEATRCAMNKMIIDMGLDQSAEWAGAIHYDTDNIHVHVMMVTTEPEATLKKMTYKEKEVYRAKIPPATQRAMKSKFGNQIANRDPTLSRISFLLRQQLVKNSLDQGYSKNLQVMRGMSQLLNTLPKDRRLWKYGNQAMINFRPLLDSLSQQIMVMNNPDSLKELDELLTDQSDFFLKAYGQEAIQSNGGKTYKDNQYETLFKNMGNALLKEMSSMVAREEWKVKNQYTPEDIQRYVEKLRAPAVTKKTLNRVSQLLEETKQDYLNQLSYRREEFRKEQQRKRDLEQNSGRSY
ncbi:MobP2 family relaxase [Enterococcus rivorum]|uniref:Relaxase n=1 Tax=Enterococcus rivorum TaxID=762845 RepID=A0A1E5L0A2_9ENTE|nr:MobP2 family relaxase [Enterococcus rivorum]MBP2098817.1 hypothetical protein [Enterococcus rivorum]OEH83550.1 hypothetical protein BCR26_08705 [Enterococcus rivorum]